MGDKEHGGPNRQSSDLQKQPDQTVVNTNICSHCGKRLCSFWDLRIHKEIHTVEKPYRCSECEDSFYTKGKLLRHRLVTHNLQFCLSFPEADVQPLSEQESHPVKGTEQNHLTASSSGESREIISQQLENKEACGDWEEHETVKNLTPMREDALLSNQVLSAVTSCGGEMSDKQCGGPHRQSSDLLQRQPDQKVENTNICSHCGKRLRSLWDLRIHEQIHTLEKPYRCSECEDSFYTKGKLLRHRLVTHNLQFSLLFPEAEVQLVSEQESHPVEGTEKDHQTASSSGESRGKISQQLEKEEVVERRCEEKVVENTDCLQRNSAKTKKRTYICPQCGKSLHSSFTLSLHIRTHTCSVCKKSFSCNSELSSHRKLHKKQHHCTECGKIFAVKARLLEHERIHTGEKPYICSDCGKHFRTKANLFTHQKCHKDEKPHQCVECKKCFRFRGHLIRHRRVHTGEKPYKCPDCGKCFNQNSDFIAHRKLHTGENSRKCLICGKTFPYKSNLLQHQRSHTGEKPYQCADCGKTFTRNSSLSLHKKGHTAEKPYKCSDCGKTFSRKSNLSLHKKGHTGEKPHQCVECGKSFLYKWYLVQHKKVHTGEKPYKCLECGKCFRFQSSLFKHEKSHRG